MGSVLDDLRREQRERILQLSPRERFALSLRLGEEGLRTLMSSHGIDRSTAQRIVRESRRRGRKPSGCFGDAA